VSHAACRKAGAHLFYPDLNESAAERVEREERATRICAACPVRDECLEYALQTRQPLGIWGGLTEPERRARIASA
jgi:WhiB family redox-sensing transcriptional regulator